VIAELLHNIPFEKLGGLGDVLFALLLGLIPAILILAAIVTPVGLLGVWAERRVSGRIQARIGPNRVGISIGPVKHHLWGLGQSVADGVKLLGKEDFVPPGGDKFLFVIAPLIVFGGSLGLFAVLPLASSLFAVDPNVGVFYVLSVGAIEVIGVLMAGWASNNKWSLIGAMREVAQVVSYEIPMGISALCPVLVVGSLKLGTLIAAQQHVNIWGWQPDGINGELFLGWNVFTAFPFNLIAFVIFYICMLANLKRAPFDLPECESELVAGFLTEYSGMRWGLFFLGEYAAMFALSGITATLFLGGWTGPVHWIAVNWCGGAPGPLFATIDGVSTFQWSALIEILGGAAEFTWKTAVLFLFQMQVRWTLPRLRLDQVMSLCYKYLVPFAMACMMFCAVAGLLGKR
jgi:NADH-quinone oxidoreductase subunit H